MIYIDNSLLSSLIDKAKASPRKRINHNFHTEASDTFQRMLNSIEPETYCQPHKHENPAKREVFIVLTGSVAVIQFDNNGEVADFIILNRATGNFGVEIPHSTWHTIIALEPGTVVYECKDGPYSPATDKDFATWAPAEGTADCAVYNNLLLKEIGFLK